MNILPESIILAIMSFTSIVVVYGTVFRSLNKSLDLTSIRGVTLEKKKIQRNRDFQ